ncbi:hypothetical protein AGIG_G6593 [Arapaima gigas]
MPAALPSVTAARRCRVRRRAAHKQEVRGLRASGVAVRLRFLRQEGNAKTSSAVLSGGRKAGSDGETSERGRLRKRVFSAARRVQPKAEPKRRGGRRPPVERGDAGQYPQPVLCASDTLKCKALRQVVPTDQQGAIQTSV